MDFFVQIFSFIGLRPWDGIFLGAWIVGMGLCAALGLEKTYKFLFGLALGCVFYVATTWFISSLSLLPISPETKGFFITNQSIFLHIAWVGIFVLPILMIFSPALNVILRSVGTLLLVLQIIFIPALIVTTGFSLVILSTERAFPFDFENFATRFSGFFSFLKQESVLYGMGLQYGVLIVAGAILVAAYVIFLSPWLTRLFERLNATKLPSFFKDNTLASAPHKEKIPQESASTSH